MMWRHMSNEPPVRISSDSGQRNIAGGLHISDIEPDGHVVHGRALHFLEGHGVAQAEGQVRGPARLAIDQKVVIRVGKHRDDVADLCPHHHTLLPDGHDLRAHAIHEVILLVDVSRQSDAGTDVDGNPCRLTVYQASSTVVRSIALRVARDNAHRVCVSKDGSHRQVVQESCVAPGDDDEGRVGGLCQYVLHIHRCRFRRHAGPSIGHGAVAADQLKELFSGGLSCAEQLQFPAQLVALAPAHGVQVSLDHLPPARAV